MTDPGPRRPDRRAPVPLWAQVADDLRGRIAAGAFADVVPGEHALTEAYGVSRHTIREALRTLRDEGLVRSERGRGTSVRGEPYRRGLGTLSSLVETLQSQGVSHRSEVLRLARGTDAEAAQHLGLPSTAPLIVVERLRLADGIPLAHDTSWLPAAVAAPLLDADLTSTALYSALVHLCGVTIDSGAEHISARVPTRAVRERLGLTARTAILHIERHAASGGRAVEWRVTDVRGDRLTLDTTWTPGSTSLSTAPHPDPATGPRP